MFSPKLHKSQAPSLKKRFFIGSSARYYASANPKKDLRSLTLDDFKPPIAFKAGFPKIKKIRKLPAVSTKKHAKLLNDLHVTGKYACIFNKCSPVKQHNVGLDTTDSPLNKEYLSMHY